MISLSVEGWRLAPSPLTISSLSAAAGVAPGTTAVTLQIEVSRAAESVVDATGQATSGVAALPPASFDLTVVLGGDGKWRLCSAQPAEPIPAGNGVDQTNPSLL